MDIEKLIEQLKGIAKGLAEDEFPKCANAVRQAATALSTLQAENEKLRAERVKLEQMAACVYYKQGGLCRYGDEDPANVCVFGPCPHQRSAQEVLAELEQVKRALAMMWFSYVNSDKEMPHSYETEALDEAERILGPWAECMPKYLRRGPKED